MGGDAAIHKFAGELLALASQVEAGWAESFLKKLRILDSRVTEAPTPELVDVVGAEFQRISRGNVTGQERYDTVDGRRGYGQLVRYLAIVPRDQCLFILIVTHTYVWHQ